MKNGNWCRKISDEELSLIKRARRGDKNAFAALWEKNRDMIFSVCLRFTKNEADAEDLAQITAYRAWAGIKTFKNESAFGTWLYAIAKNEMRMIFRKKRLPTLPIDDLYQQAINGDGEAIQGERELASIADRMLVEKLISSLPNGYRRAIILHDFEELKYAEVAKIMGCTVSNAKTQRLRALGYMLKILAKLYGFKPPKGAGTVRLRNELRSLSARILCHQAA